MLNVSKDSLSFYPAYCFSASPTYNAWVKLTATGVHTLRARRGFEGQGVYFFLNHPVRWIQVVGLVVDFEPNDRYLLFHVDDGSGALLEIVLPRKETVNVPLAKPGESVTLVTNQTIGVSALGNEIDLRGIEIGVTVKVKGGIREFRNVKQIALERLFYLKDTTSEIQSWEASVSQYQDTLSRPWRLDKAEEEALKRKAQGQAERRESKNGAKSRKVNAKPSKNDTEEMLARAETNRRTRAA